MCYCKNCSPFLLNICATCGSMDILLDRCRVNVSPTNVSPTESSWMLRPLYDVSLGLIIPDRCVPTWRASGVANSLQQRKLGDAWPASPTTLTRFYRFVPLRQVHMTYECILRWSVLYIIITYILVAKSIETSSTSPGICILLKEFKPVVACAHEYGVQGWKRLYCTWHL
jgi:hypothetical protein